MTSPRKGILGSSAWCAIIWIPVQALLLISLMTWASAPLPPPSFCVFSSLKLVPSLLVDVSGHRCCPGVCEQEMDQVDR